MSALPHSRGDEYLEFCDGIRRTTGIDLTQYKRPQMERRIRSFAERHGVATLDGYLQVLSKDAAQLERFLDRVTINVSQLWRNPEQFEHLAGMLPGLATAGRLRCWSAGCSYGAEAYTLAALCLTAAPAARAEVHGTDIDARMIDRARTGRFTAEDVRSAPADALRRWFLRTPDGGWEAKPELKLLTRFQTGDLLRDRFPRGAYDVVLCRNVVIYFTEEVRDRLHERLAESLRPGGVLMIGSSERVTAPAAMGLEPVVPFVYRRA